MTENIKLDNTLEATKHVDSDENRESEFHRRNRLHIKSSRRLQGRNHRNTNSQDHLFRAMRRAEKYMRENADKTFTGNSNTVLAKTLEMESVQNVRAEGWLSITSNALANPNYYPDLFTDVGLQRVSYNRNFTRLNGEYDSSSKDIPYPTAFYFKLNENYLYYYTKPTAKHILASIPIKAIELISLEIRQPMCFKVVDFLKNNWVFCGLEKKDAIKFVCPIQKSLDVEPDRSCDGGLGATPPKFVVKTITQPLIIIPMPSKQCNNVWDYEDHGLSWECDCKEGMEQSPIDLPTRDKAIDSPFKPIFEYEIVDKKMTTNDAELDLKVGDAVKVRYQENALKIKHPNMGKIITPDGSVFQAKEIVFHTPSEHTIDGKRFDAEMQIIHRGISEGDINKHVVLSLIFVATPGALNKFFDKINVYNLPNPADKFKEISDNFYIPYVFYESEDQDINLPRPFSFFTYQGSLTAPPCVERTIHYVSSEPIPLSNTAITLLREALRPPDSFDVQGNIRIDSKQYMNYRNTQPLNGRAIFHYDHNKMDCPDFKNYKLENKDHESGHYEKVIKETEKYFFVPGFKPSGVPHAYVVPDNEANGEI